LSLAVSGVAQAAPPKSAADRVAARSFPSVFQAWNGADNLNEDRLATMARHDLLFHAPDFFGLEWDAGSPGLGTRFIPASVDRANRFRAELLAKNPSMVLLAELRYFEAHRSYLPADHPWWKRKDGRIVPGWEEGGYWKLDFANRDFQNHVAAQAAAVMRSGVVNGIMLDCWQDEDDWVGLLTRIRRAVGDDALILINCNDRIATRSAPLVNGIYVEAYKTETPEDWKRVEAALVFAEANVRRPKINCLETWFRRSRKDEHLLRAATALSMTRSDGYVLFGDPNDLPSPDHAHDWHALWDQSLGRATAPGEVMADKSVRRAFTGGLVVYNPAGNDRVTVAFGTPHRSAATGVTGTTFAVPALDGDLFLQVESE
jgi:hypothetical protein